MRLSEYVKRAWTEKMLAYPIRPVLEDCAKQITPEYPFTAKYENPRSGLAGTSLYDPPPSPW